MREIKFRGKRIDNGEWVIGSLIKCGITGKAYIFPIDCDANESDKVGEEGCLRLVTFEVIPETIGQYTGLKDKNGMEIYEGDKIFDEHREYWGYVEFDEGCFHAVLENVCYKLFEVQDEIQVIGNIYEDEELVDL